MGSKIRCQKRVYTVVELSILLPPEYIKWFGSYNIIIYVYEYTALVGKWFESVPLVLPAPYMKKRLY